MKKLISAAAFALLVASPVIAQTSEEGSPSVSTGTRSATTTRSAPRAVRQQEPRRNSANDVYGISGHYVGSDPDPRVRQMLNRDAAMEGDD